jgi:stage II sporulation protein D
MGSLLFINICDIESYIGGVVKAEGGSGKKEEYFKTQAIIARTYTYRHLNRHILDRYNLCDNTHCQVFNGVITDSLITKAVDQTRDLVIVTPDSNLIISAFHSNCGGETSPSEYAWPAKQPYLIRVADPYCVKSRNASWGKVVPLTIWTDMLAKNGFSGAADSASRFDYNQPSRMQDYITGSFSLPFSKIRTDLDLRSAWFSVKAEGDSLRLTGRGYGHGVGLCQEGAMVMAAKGFGYEDIIRFYYHGVKIITIANAKKSDEEKVPGKIQKAN